jgi:hypothetical protein
MKKVLLPILLGLTIVSWKTSKHANCDAYSQTEIQDSTVVPTNYEYQRALAIYILSRPKKEQKEWISGTFTEEEKNVFLKKLEKN